VQALGDVECGADNLFDSFNSDAFQRLRLKFWSFNRVLLLPHIISESELHLRFKKMNSDSPQSEQAIPPDIQSRLDKWRKHFTFNIRAHHILGTIGVFSSSLAAISIERFGISRYSAVASAIIFGWLGFTKPEQEYAKFVNAWRILDSAVSKYRHGLISLEALLEAKDQGEQLIAGSERSLDAIKRIAPSSASAGSRVKGK
jgi:hypothetical protein